MSVSYRPDGYHTVTPYLVAEGVSALLEFLPSAFDAEVVARIELGGGSVAHAEVRIGDSMVMMGEAHGEQVPMPCGLYLYVEDVDRVYAKAIEAGAASIREPADQFYGDRNAGVIGPCGNHWWISTHVEDQTEEEIAKRTAAHEGGCKE